MGAALVGKMVAYAINPKGFREVSRLSEERLER